MLIWVVEAVVWVVEVLVDVVTGYRREIWGITGASVEGCFSFRILLSDNFSHSSDISKTFLGDHFGHGNG